MDPPRQGPTAPDSRQSVRRWGGARPVPPPFRPYREWPLSAIVSHLELIRLLRMGGSKAVRRAGGEPALEHQEAGLRRELERRQMRLDV